MKVSVYLVMGVLACTLSCSKNATVEPQQRSGNYPAWIDDESQEVPIQFGLGAVADTKADQTIEFDGKFRDPAFRYGVLAVDNLGATHRQVNGIAAKNVPTTMWEDGREGMLKTVFVDAAGNKKDYYYPMVSDKGYTFYGYRTDNTNTGFGNITTSGSGTATRYTVNNVQVGSTDIIWAKAEAPLGTGGYNASYIRGLISATVPPTGYEDYRFYLYNSLAPRFEFGHLTSRFVFVVRAEDSAAEASMIGLVRIKGLRIENVGKVASLDITSGSLSCTSSGGTMNVVREGSAPYYPLSDDAPYGDPLFVLPSSSDTYAAQNGIRLVMDVDTPENPDYQYTTILRYNGIQDGFEAGKSYRFVITLKSLEAIEISATIGDWIDAEGSADPYIIG